MDKRKIYYSIQLIINNQRIMFLNNLRQQKRLSGNDCIFQIIMTF